VPVFQALNKREYAQKPARAPKSLLTARLEALEVRPKKAEKI
jgi:hypothetical protein